MHISPTGMLSLFDLIPIFYVLFCYLKLLYDALLTNLILFSFKKANMHPRHNHPIFSKDRLFEVQVDSSSFVKIETPGCEVTLVVFHIVD